MSKDILQATADRNGGGEVACGAWRCVTCGGARWRGRKSAQLDLESAPATSLHLTSTPSHEDELKVRR